MDLITCEDCYGTEFHIDVADGAIYCSGCDVEDDGSYGRMVGIEAYGDGSGPDGWLGAARRDVDKEAVA